MSDEDMDHDVAEDGGWITGLVNDVSCTLCGSVFPATQTHHDCPAQGPEALACYKACKAINPANPLVAAEGLEDLVRTAQQVLAGVDFSLLDLKAALTAIKEE